MTVTGFCRFHFWGDYNQTFVLRLSSAEEAANVIELLNCTAMTTHARDACGRLLQIDRWRHCKDPKYIAIMVTGQDIDTLTDMMLRMGADKRKIGSMARSVDRGEDFEIHMEIESKDQLKLALDL